jgi:hypothetical protein
MSERHASKTAVLSEVNQRVLEAALDSITEEQEWEFFCECGNADCHQHVKLTVHAYSVLHDGGRAVLAAGHGLSPFERARRLREDADALRRQAEHQVRRAKRNVGAS